MAKPVQQNTRSPWLIIIIILAVLTVFSIGVVGCVGVLVASDGIETGNVAVIPLKGIIVVDSNAGLFSTGYAVSTDVVEQIEKAEKDDTIKAIVLDINSPGGSPVASAEIARAISEAEKPTVALIREYGASGAYWIASSADHIIANEVSVTGSIGVIASYLQYSELMERYNVSYERFIAGEHKDMGSPYREMTSEEKAIYQNVLDKMRGVFIREVAQNRGLEYDYVEELATGQIYLGIDALNFGLIDELGGKKEAYKHIETLLDIKVRPVEFSTEKSFLEMLASAMDDTAFNMGTGIGAVLVEENNGGIKI
ncbi:signal peptide peptidase SppA [Candidatus Woesearchaeota archaeon CG10_big_fil_rev_8_21_14_0_10_34_8]|nr:MAG: signal peptide peptidase SppA [Candidatus Woesearchaeota archaeon CG10_big_fil_rev_8_21_14_0_10_34_8]